MRDIEEEYATKTGIPRGDALSPILFAIYLEAIMRHHRETYPATGIQEDFTLQYPDDSQQSILQDASNNEQPRRGQHKTQSEII